MYSITVGFIPMTLHSTGENPVFGVFSTGLCSDWSSVSFIKLFPIGPMLLPSGNPFKCHEEVLYFQLLIPPKRFDIFSPRLGDAQKEV